MKLLIKSLFTVLLSIFGYNAYAETVTNYINPLRGYSILKSIPKSELYVTFCQLEYEQEKDISPERILGCHEALHIIGTRLLGLAAGFKDNPVDIEFLKQINAALLQNDNLYHSATENPIRFGVIPKNENAKKENILIAENIYLVTGSDLQTTLLCHSAQYYKNLIKSFKYNSFFYSNTSLECYYQESLACFDAHQDQKTLEEDSADYQTLYFLEILKSTRQKPTPLRLKKVNSCDNLSPYYIFSLPTEAQVIFFNNLFENINAKLKNHTSINIQSLNEEIVKISRAVLLTHAFRDGNTRTSRLLLNMLRLSAGLEPYQSNFLPDPRDWSSIDMVQQYYSNLIKPSSVKNR